MALASAAPATAEHPAGLPSGAAGGLPPPEPAVAPTLSGTAVEGATVTGHDGTWEGNPSFSREWLRCDGSDCAFLHDTDSSYTLGTADVGKTVRLRVLATTVGGGREVDTAPTAAVSPAQLPAAQTPPFPTAGDKPSTLIPPSVEGTLREGQIILASPGSWLGSNPMTFSNRWDRCDIKLCVPTGELRFLTQLTKDDVGMRMRARVTASNLAGDTPVYTEQSAIVKPRIPRYERLEPFPVIVISGIITRPGVRLRRLAVRAPRGSTLRLTCRGQGCPYRSARARLRTNLFRVRKMLGRPLEAGTVIELRVTARDKIGKYTRFRILRDRKPARMDRCLVPAQPRPSRCSPAS